MSETEVPVLEELAELEATLRQLTLAALKLPSGAERRDSLVAIGSFRERTAAIKQYRLDQASIIRLLKRSA